MSRGEWRWWALLILSMMCLYAARSEAQTGPSGDACANIPPGSGDWYKYKVNDSLTNFGAPTGFVFSSQGAACGFASDYYCSHDGTPGEAPCMAADVPWVGHVDTSCKTADGDTPIALQNAAPRQLQSNPAVDCPPDPPGECNTGLSGGKFTASDWRDLSAVPHDFCSPVSDCKVTVRQATGSGGATVWSMIHTFDDCFAGQEDGPAEEDTSVGESCVAFGDGQYCASAAGSGQCGYLNDSFICIPDVPDGGCKSMSGGSMLCDSAADSPPAPDNGTPGVPATADATVENVSEQGGGAAPGGGAYDYYDADTVAGSSRDSTEGGSSGGSGGGTDHPAAGGGSGDGTDEGEEGDEGELTTPEIGEACTFGECAQDFYNRVTSSAFLSSVANVGSAWPVASCPSYNLEMFGETYSLSAPMCSLWEDISPVLSVLFLAIWAWIATRIVLSA